MGITVKNVRDQFRNDPPKIKALIVGAPGSGKTRSASTWPNVLYANAEGGLLSVRDRDLRQVEINATTELDELRSALAQTPAVRAQLLGGPVDAVVLDTLDEIARIIIRERLESEKHETMQMADWGYLGDTLRALVRGYRNLDLHVLFLVHVKGQEDSATGRLVYRPSIQGAMGDELAAYVDLAVLMVARPTTDPKTGDRVISRFLQTFPDMQHEWLKDRSGRLPMEFPINFEDDYARLAALIFGETEPARAKPAPKASVEASKPKELTPPSEPSPDPEPEPTPEPDPLPDPVAETEPAPETVPEPGTAADPLADLDEVVYCAQCGKPVESVDFVHLSMMRFGEPLCRQDFAERKRGRDQRR